MNSDNKNFVLDKLDNTNITKVNIQIKQNRQQIMTNLTTILDLLLYYLGHGDVPEGLLLGLELKVKVRLWELAHSSVSSTCSLFKDKKDYSMKDCGKHIINLMNECNNLLPEGNGIKGKIMKSLEALGPFGIVIDQFRRGSDKSSLDIFNDLININSSTKSFISKIAEADILFDYDGTVDSCEKIGFLEHVASYDINVKILTARDSKSLKEDVNEYYGKFPSNVEILSIADDYKDIMRPSYASPIAAVVKSLLVATNNNIVLFDDSKLVESMFKCKNIKNQLINADRLTYGKFVCEIILCILKKLQKDIDSRSDLHEEKLNKQIEILKILNDLTIEWYSFDLKTPEILNRDQYDKIFSDITLQKFDGGISFCAVTGHAGTGKSTLINEYLKIEDFQKLVYAKDIAHLTKKSTFNKSSRIIENEYLYSFDYKNAKLSNDIAVFIKQHFNNIAYTSQFLIILDGASFDNFGDVIEDKILKIQSQKSSD
jgi:ABC-type multidrug transport system fused ATPase/permease subunit